MWGLLKLPAGMVNNTKEYIYTHTCDNCRLHSSKLHADTNTTLDQVEGKEQHQTETCTQHADIPCGV